MLLRTMCSALEKHRMTQDHAALEAKKMEIRQLANTATSSLSQASSKTSDAVLNAFVQLTPPIDPPITIEFITLSSSGRSGSSRKPGHILLNWRKLFVLLPDIVLAGSRVATAPVWIDVFAALQIWTKLYSGMKQDFSEAEATVMYSLWKNHENKKIAETTGFEQANKFRREASLNALSMNEFGAVVNRLIQMRCIEMTDGVIWLREWAKIAYS